MKFNKMVLKQQNINFKRIKRARMLSPIFGRLSQEELQQDIEKGVIELMKLSKEEIIQGFIDDLDKLMVGHFTK